MVVFKLNKVLMKLNKVNSKSKNVLTIEMQLDNSIAIISTIRNHLYKMDFKVT